MLDFRIEKEDRIAQAERPRDQDGLDLDVNDIEGKGDKAAKALKTKAGRAVVIAPLRLFSDEGKERLYRAQLRQVLTLASAFRRL